MSDDIKNRFRSILREEESSDGIFAIWKDQEQLEEEDKKLEQELKDAKKRARELRKTLYANKFGKVQKETEKSPKAHIAKVKSFASKRKNQKLALAVLGVIVVAGVTAKVITGGNSQPATLSDVSDGIVANPEEDLVREKPEFNLLYPAGQRAENYDVVRVSRPGAEASYTYLDRFTEGGPIFRVTQQEVPSGLDVSKAANEFQATDIIQVDDTIVYHGYSEKGGIQSLILVKDEKLISIRSPQKFSDDLWANYIISLK